MRPCLILFGLSTFALASAQLPTPNAPCKYDRLHSSLRRVKEPTSFQLDLIFHPQSSDLSYTFLPGTMVSVSQQEDGWSCVFGTKWMPSGWTGFSGWLPSSQLEKLAEDSGSNK
jgi:hypothetical protein